MLLTFLCIPRLFGKYSMITNTQKIEQVLDQIKVLTRGLEAINNDKKASPKNKNILAEGPLDQRQDLLGQLGELLGIQ